MKRQITHLLVAAATVAALAAPAVAQTPEVCPEENAAPEIIDAPAVAPDEYKTVRYGDFKMQVPASAELTGDKNVIIKTSDGSFGVSLDKGEARGSKQKRALTLCRDLAIQLRVKDVSVKAVKMNGMKGALAKGTLEGQEVTVVILPAGKEELRVVVMNAPSRRDWTDRLLRTISK